VAEREETLEATTYTSTDLARAANVATEHAVESTTEHTADFAANVAEEASTGVNRAANTSTDTSTEVATNGSIEGATNARTNLTGEAEKALKVKDCTSKERPANRESAIENAAEDENDLANDGVEVDAKAHEDGHERAAEADEQLTTGELAAGSDETVEVDVAAEETTERSEDTADIERAGNP
jgi:hypothetical protein